jgi:hypothetical protein
MNSILLSKSDLFTTLALRRCAPLGLQSVIALAVVILISTGTTFARNAPERTTDEHTSRETPFAEESRGEIPITAKGLMTILHGNNFTNS